MAAHTEAAQYNPTQFLTMAPNADEWSIHVPAPLSSQKKPPALIDKRQGGD